MLPDLETTNHHDDDTSSLYDKAALEAERPPATPRAWDARRAASWGAPHAASSRASPMWALASEKTALVALVEAGRGVRRRTSSVLPRPRPCGRETGAGAVASAPEDRYGLRLTAVKRRIRTCNPPCFWVLYQVELALAFQASCADILPSSEPVRGMRLVQGTSAPPAREPSASLRTAAATRRGRDDPRRGSLPSSRA